MPLRLNLAVLSEPGCYHLILDAVQALCARASIYPCILDAAICASFDRDAVADDWTDFDAV